MTIKGLFICIGLLSIFTNTSKAAETLSFKNKRPFIQLISNVVYEQVPSRGYSNVPMRMDILQPRSKEKLPAIIYVTGGGFINANKDSYIQQRMDLAEAGYVVASIEYRVAPTAAFPQPLEDLKAAIRFLRANSDKFGILPDKIGLMGGSAGGYLVSMAGATNGMKDFDKGENLDQNSDVQAVVDTYGVTDLTKIGADYSPEVQELHKSAGATEALWVNGSPVFGGKDGGINADPEATKKAQIFTYISAKTPPFLIMHGDADKVVSPSQSTLLYDALKDKGIEATLYSVKNAEHGGPFWIQQPVMDKIISFFNKHLK